MRVYAYLGIAFLGFAGSMGIYSAVYEPYATVKRICAEKRDVTFDSLKVYMERAAKAKGEKLKESTLIETRYALELEYLECKAEGYAKLNGTK